MWGVELRCNKCGTENSPNVKYCKECGNKLYNNENTSLDGYKGNSGKNRNLFLISVVVLAMIVVVAVGLSGILNLNTVTIQNNSSGDSNSIQKNQGDTQSVPHSNSTPKKVECPECGGVGTVTCYNTVTGGESCEGTGIVQGGPTAGRICHICNGLGYITYPTCEGEGYVTE